MSALRVLAVFLEPDDRPGADQWRAVMQRAAERTDVEVLSWFLRDTRSERWSGARNVDDLRTWWVNRMLSAMGSALVASWLRGRRLRRWFAADRPDVIVLDAGWGERIVGAAGGRGVVAVRHDPWAPTEDVYEERCRTPGVIALAEHPDGAAGDPTTGRPSVVHWSPYLTRIDPWQRDLPAERLLQRDRLGLGADDVVVVGWGEDGWVDGSELFVRTLWYLADRHGAEAHGVWIAPLDDPTEVEHLRLEAERCGLSRRLHLVSPDGPIDLRCGDVVHLPRRVPLTWDDPATCAAADLTLVTSGEVRHPAPWVRTVPLLDLPAAAAELHRALGERPARWVQEVDPDGVLDRLLRAVDSASPG